MQVSLDHALVAPTHQEISTAVAQGVRAPLAALRASIESLSRAFSAGDPGSLAAQGALDEVVRLGHEIQAILDYALPPPAQALSCSMREIVCSALDGLALRDRPHVLLAIEDRRARFTVDGPLLSRSITRLLAAVPTDDLRPALLRARVEGTDVVFALVQDVPGGAGSDHPSTRSRSAVSALGSSLARRDVERMGGRFSVRAEANGNQVSEIRFPGEIADGGRA